MNKEEIIQAKVEELRTYLSMCEEILLNELNDYIKDLQQENEKLKVLKDTLIETNMLLLQQKGRLQEDLDMLDNRINKAIEVLGQYRHYFVPDEIQNRENEKLAYKAYEILKGEEND